jgi:membrane-associated phospholipid phosphatase
MTLAEQKVIDSCAHWIGAPALALLLVIFLTVLGVIAALRHLLERRRLDRWAHPDSWHRHVLERPFAQMLRQRHPRLWCFFGARLATDNYLGLHLTIGLLVTLAAMVGFGALADAVADQEELTEFDQQLAASLHQNGTIDQIGIFEAITRFGDYWTLVCLGLAVSLILLISRRRLLLIGWVVALAGSGFLNAMLKALFHRARPVLANPWLTEPGWSFPSGHAMGSLVAYGMLAYILIVAWRVRFPRMIIAVTIALVLAIGFSRIYLGVHFFTDVAAGYAAALMWLAICVSGCEVARRREQMRRMAADLRS